MNLELRDLQHPGECLGEAVFAFAEALRVDIENVEDDSPTRIHDIRVGTKKLRALLRLGAEAIPDATPLASRLREIRQTFSGTRDADVMRQRVAELFADAAPAVLRELELESKETSESLPKEEALRIHGELDALLRGIPFATVTRIGLIENVTRSYRRARKLMGACQESPGDDVLMHDWRKRAKDVCYHAMALGTVKTMQKRTAPLDALAEKLGEFHDLSVLGDRANGHELISSVVGKEKHRSRRECFKAAKKLFRRKPSALKEKLASRIVA
jgi:CHAD domain-containing protein